MSTINMNQGDMEYLMLVKKVLTLGTFDEEGGTSHGVHWEDGIPAKTKRLPLQTRVYDLSVGKSFPIITLRRSAFKSAVEEMVWMWQKNSNDIADIKSNIWDSWATKNGTIGKAYGYQLGRKYVYNDTDDMLTQVEKLFFDLANTPNSRRMICTMWNPSDLREMTMEPCAHTIQVLVTNGVLHMMLNQRSQDILVAGDWNIVQYVVLQMILAEIFHLKLGRFMQCIGDTHIYDRHIPIIEEVIAGKLHPVPKFGEVQFFSDDFLNRCKDVDPTNWKDAYAAFQFFTPEMFTVPGYNENKTYNTYTFDKNIPVAI